MGLLLMLPSNLLAQNMPTTNGEQQRLQDNLMQSESKLNAKQQRLKEQISEKVSTELLKQATTARDPIGNSSDTTGRKGARLQISLLTCGPGNEVYEYYGHSAIRVLRTDSAGLDLTFNYGVFDFNTNNFALKFAMGDTYYLCVAQPTQDFVDSYRHSGRYIDEQILNLTQNECLRIYSALMENIKPENRTYLYNFLYDNCATRVRDIIENNLDSKLQYPERPTERSFRDAIHFFCRNAKWSIFGQDLLLGAQADMPATGRELEFAPLILEQDIDNALVMSESFAVHTLVLKKHRLLEAGTIDTTPAFPLSPTTLATLLLIGAVVLGAWEIRKKRIIWPVDSVLLLTQGIAGFITTFVFFFSAHPTVGSNWLVWILNPLPLVGLYWQLRGARRHDYKQYHMVAAPILALFLIVSKSLPQHFGPTIIVLALLLLVRSTTNLIVWHKVRKATSTLHTH